MTARLFGVGVGPGDPELITVKAVRVLTEAGLVLVPVMADSSATGPGRAEAVVRAHIDGARIRRVAFALNDRGGVTARRRAAWNAAAREVAAAFAAGTPTVAFATIGDPNLYSTFSYLAQTVSDLVPGVSVHTVPGITAMQDLAARSGTVLAEGGESVVLLPLVAASGAGAPPGRRGRSGGPAMPRGRAAALGAAAASAATSGVPEAAALTVLREALRTHDTVVAYKLGAALRGRAAERHAAGDVTAVLAALEETGRLGDAIYGARLGLPGEDIRPASQLAANEAVPYLATLIAPGRRSGTGSRLG